MDTFDIGPIRPPSEANSLLLRVTKNCPWNKCNFCTLYKQERFETRQVEEIKRDIDAMAYYRDEILSHFHKGEFDMPSVKHTFSSLTESAQRECYAMVFRWLTEGKRQAIFLQDANTMVLRYDRLSEIVRYVRHKLPEINRVTSYGRADTLSKITPEGYRTLREAGLDRIHSGFESGSDRVLELLGKGTTKLQEIEGGQKVRDAGIQLSIYFMPGAGGSMLSDENASQTADVINQINPDFVRLRTFVVKNNSPMGAMKAAGAFQEATDEGKVLEIRNLLSQIKNCTGQIESDQIINLLDQVRGSMATDLPKMIAYIDEFLSLPFDKKRQFQLARRMGFQGDWNDLPFIVKRDMDKIVSQCSQVMGEQEWEDVLHRYLEHYI